NYLCGPAFLTRTNSLFVGRRETTAADVEHAFRSPPRSTEQVLHPEKYWDHADEASTIEIPTDGLPDGWSVARDDTLGELLLGILCTPPEERGGLVVSNPLAPLGVHFTNELAEGWGGDRIVLLANGAARFLELVTRWDSERDAAEFYGALLVLRP